MANTLLVPSQITKEALMVLENQLGVVGNMRREYDDRFGVEGAKIGDTLNLRLPPRFITSKGQALNLQDATETSVPLTLTEQAQCAMAFTSRDLTLFIDDFSKRFIKPAIANMANTVDFDATLLYQKIYNVIGTPGATPNAALTYLQAAQRLDEEAAPRDERVLTFTPAMNASIVDALKGLFNSQNILNKQYRKGLMAADTLGFDWYMDQNLRTHKVGPLGGAPQVNGANQTGATLATSGWTAAAANRLKAGDVFTIANVNAVNPQNRQSTGALRQFVVTVDFNSAADGTGNISISPAITLAGPFQTVDALPVNGTALTILGAANTLSPQGLAFHPEALAFGCADLLLPGGVDFAERARSKKIGMSIRLVRQYDINLDRFPVRGDMIYGFAVPYPQLATRIAG